MNGSLLFSPCKSGWWLAMAVAAAGLGGCKASVKGDFETAFEADPLTAEEEKAERDDRLRSKRLQDDGETIEAEDEAAPTASYALLGARPDLMLVGTQGAECQCLRAYAGQPEDPSFGWQMVVPRTNPEQQVVVAFTSDGITCPGAPAGSLGASYWGYREEGDDTVIVVEAGNMSRPVTVGAIVPKPRGNGAIVIEPLRAGLPYAKPQAGQRRCEVSPSRAPTRAADRVIPLPKEKPKP